MSATILIVEDDKELRDTMESFLLKKGYNVLTSPDGWSSLKEVVVKKPDLILMDINMPKLNGLNTLDLIKTTKLTIQVPIVVMSAKSDPETIQKALALGADDFVEKPFSYEQALAYIELQLLSLKLETVKATLANLRSPVSVEESLGAEDAAAFQGYDAYPVSHQGIEWHVLIQKNLSPIEAAKLPKAELSNAVMIFAQGSKKWKKLFPAVAAENQKLAA